MGLSDIKARFDAFQAEAVHAIASDFSRKIDGRYLLVIPTGGGKTTTAVKAINDLFRQNILNAESDRVVWAAHRQELIAQAKDAFGKFETEDPDASFNNRVTIMMISRVAAHLMSHNEVKLVVIDEAHHAATANIQYGPIFDYPSLGILGLTATPSRHDGQPLGQVTISCGVATFPVHAGAKDDLIRLADQSLYAAKRNGRNQVSQAKSDAVVANAPKEAAA